MAENKDREAVTSGGLAERMNETLVSANEMVRRWNERALVPHTPYERVALTEKGHEVASNVVRRQRLWECFLHDHLRHEWAQVCQLACALDHATVPEVADALA